MMQEELQVVDQYLEPLQDPPSQLTGPLWEEIEVESLEGKHHL